MDLHQRHLWSGRLKTGRRKQNKKNFGDFFLCGRPISGRWNDGRPIINHDGIDEQGGVALAIEAERRWSRNKPSQKQSPLGPLPKQGKEERERERERERAKYENKKENGPGFDSILFLVPMRSIVDCVLRWRWKKTNATKMTAFSVNSDSLRPWRGRPFQDISPVALGSGTGMSWNGGFLEPNLRRTKVNDRRCKALFENVPLTGA